MIVGYSLFGQIDGMPISGMWYNKTWLTWLTWLDVNLTYRPLFDQITITITCAVIHRNKLELYWITYAIFLEKKLTDFNIYYTKKREGSLYKRFYNNNFIKENSLLFYIYYERYFINWVFFEWVNVIYECVHAYKLSFHAVGYYKNSVLRSFRRIQNPIKAESIGKTVKRFVCVKTFIVENFFLL